MRRLVQELLGLADAQSMRRALLAELMEASGTSIGLSHGLVLDAERELRIVDVVSAGPAGAEQHLQGLHGVPYRDLGFTPHDMMQLGVAFGRFSVLMPEDLPDLARQRMWEPLGVHAGLAINLVHDGVFLGHVLLMRGRDEDVPGASDLVSLRSWPKVMEQVHLAAAARLEGVPEGEALLVIDHDRRPTMSGGQSRHWQQPALRRSIYTLIERLESSDEPGPVDGYVDGVLLRVQRLTGVNRQDGCLVRVLPVRPWSVPPVLELPPVSRRVAALAAQGATAADIAETLGRSQDTVRTHLRRAYEALDISSRTELTRIISALGRPA